MDNAVQPDVDSDLAGEPEEVGHCPQCMTPFEAGQYYCNKCGFAVGNLTPYVPFVNIPFECYIWQRMWKRVWSDDPATGFLKRALFLTMIGAMQPVMLLGLPFAFRKKDGPADRTPPPEEAPQ